MNEHRTDVARRPDLPAGARPALYLALGIGVITGGSVVVMMVVTAILIPAIGGIGSGTSGLFTLVGVSIAFWIGTSLGVILGFGAGFRAWVALYPAYVHRSEATEGHAAVYEAELLLRDRAND